MALRAPCLLTGHVKPTQLLEQRQSIQETAQSVGEPDRTKLTQVGVLLGAGKQLLLLLPISSLFLRSCGADAPGHASRCVTCVKATDESV
jgi:hypothetical protein